MGSDDDGYAVRLKLKHFAHYLASPVHSRDDSPLYIFDGTFADRDTSRYAIPSDALRAHGQQHALGFWTGQSATLREPESGLCALALRNACNPAAAQALDVIRSLSALSHAPDTKFHCDCCILTCCVMAAIVMRYSLTGKSP